MRVIAGKARRLQLKTVKGMDTRPTTDRIKETLFNIINDLMYDAVIPLPNRIPVDGSSGSADGIRSESHKIRTLHYRNRI